MENQLAILSPAEISADWATIDSSIDKLLEPFSDMTQEVADSMDYKTLKAMRAEINRIDKELNDGRKAVKAQYNAPLAAFEAECKERTQRIQKPNAFIKAAIAKKDNALKSRRKEELAQFYEEYAPALIDVLPFDNVLDPKWLNRSVNITKAKDELAEKVEKIASDWKSLKDSNLFNPQQTEIKFFQTLDIGSALNYDRELKAQQEKLEELHRFIEPEPAEHVPFDDVQEIANEREYVEFNEMEIDIPVNMVVCVRVPSKDLELLCDTCEMLGYESLFASVDDNSFADIKSILREIGETYA